MRNMKDSHCASSATSKTNSSLEPSLDFLQPFRVLIVEDHAESARLLKKLLEQFGYSVVSATSGESAIEIASNETFDLIISDIGLPDFDGYELMRMLRAQFGLTGVALTGFSEDEKKSKSAECGFVQHLVKPVDISEIHAAVERIRNAKERAATI